MMKGGRWPIAEVQFATVAMVLASVQVLMTSALVVWVSPLLAERMRAFVDEASGAAGLGAGMVAAILAVSACVRRRP